MANHKQHFTIDKYLKILRPEEVSTLKSPLFVINEISVYFSGTR